jgi:hypothetical protein
MTTEKTSLHRKLAEVMAEVERIPKRGKAPPEMGGFAFTQVGDALDPIRKAMAERQLTMVPSEIDITGQSEHEGTGSRGQPVVTTTLDLRVTWTITDGESGESIRFQSIGAGADRGDKYTGKAMTNALKYAILPTFLLPTGDDPELSNSEDRGRRPSPPATPNPDGSLIGLVEKGKPPVDYELRQTPDGPACGFALVEGRTKLQVLATGRLADSLAVWLPQLTGVRVKVWGSIDMIPWDKDGKKMPPYRRVALERIETPDFTLPASDEVAEAPSEELFKLDPDEAAMVGAGLPDAAA